ncbi:hypothetical protein LSM04_000739 [Trypanosoma melophagium]|uniref:uncharacterized protein n=1 Tax=Trypanosoma melophagium TaxID=715481 RepID=UPI003519E371|nr:hypothetical protein LSM04_000739 [Trypanosoma melophagium]
MYSHLRKEKGLYQGTVNIHNSDFHAKQEGKKGKEENEVQEKQNRALETANRLRGNEEWTAWSVIWKKLSDVKKNKSPFRYFVHGLTWIARNVIPLAFLDHLNSEVPVVGVLPVGYSSMDTLVWLLSPGPTPGSVRCVNLQQKEQEGYNRENQQIGQSLLFEWENVLFELDLGGEIIYVVNSADERQEPLLAFAWLPPLFPHPPLWVHFSPTTDEICGVRLQSCTEMTENKRMLFHAIHTSLEDVVEDNLNLATKRPESRSEFTTKEVKRRVSEGKDLAFFDVVEQLLAKAGRSTGKPHEGIIDKILRESHV